jgi:hypothetical protein
MWTRATDHKLDAVFGKFEAIVGKAWTFTSEEGGIS